jgi:hypothetical protein
MAEAQTTTVPARAPRKRTAPAKTAAAPKTATPVETAPVTTEAATADNTTKVVLNHVSTSKRYEKFTVPPELEALHFVGQLYAPVGTTEVRVLFVR